MTERTTVEILKAARKRIEDPSRWTQGFMAMAGHLPLVNGFDPRATCWCALGALEAELGRDCIGLDGGDDPVVVALTEAADGRFPGDVNDNEGHAAALAIFDRAIAAEEQKAEKGGPA
jgi:hypothetical protein